MLKFTKDKLNKNLMFRRILKDKMGQATSRVNQNTEIIPLKTFLAVQDAIQYLKENADVEGIFRRDGGSYIKPRILRALRRGDRHALHLVLYPTAEEVARIQDLAVPGNPTVDAQIALDCGAALITLVVDLPKPLFPLRVQRLILDGNEGIPVANVAYDAIGLLKQDLSGRHFSLVSSFLDLLYTVSKKSQSTELGGPSIAVSLLLTLFQLGREDLKRWQHSAAIFSELIALAPRYMGPRQTAGVDDDSGIQSAISHDVQEPLINLLPFNPFNGNQDGRRRPRTRSPRRCLLGNVAGGSDHLPILWASQMQGMLHPVLAGTNEE